MIEAQVHSSLRDLLKTRGDRDWPHHLTMARLVARALRVSRPALMQTGSSVRRYCWSYLMPVLLGDWSVVVVAPPATQTYLLESEIPLLQDWLQTNKQVRIGDRWQPEDDLLLTTPASWLSDRLQQESRFPPHLPALIDQADYLEDCARRVLTIPITIADWDELMQHTSQHQELIRNTRIKLTKSILARPQNPYQNYTLDESESELIGYLCHLLAQESALTPKFSQFWQQWQSRDTILWTSRNRERGLFTIYLAPAEVAAELKPIWQEQSIVIIGSFLDLESSAPIYRQKLGLESVELLCLKFSPHRQNEHIQLYLPDGLPMHNTPQFRTALLEQASQLVGLGHNSNQLTVILVEDVPLQAQVGSYLAAEFGSRVKVETTSLATDGVLVCSWSFWQAQQQYLPAPRLLIIATLPLPSPENPIVASRIAYYKTKRQDWFHLYLLPTSLRTIQQAVVPLRESQGIVALLDNRVNYRSYGKTILSALEPCARINYIDPSWFG